jgi:hypothetical protein
MYVGLVVAELTHFRQGEVQTHWQLTKAPVPAQMMYQVPGVIGAGAVMPVVVPVVVVHLLVRLVDRGLVVLALLLVGLRTGAELAVPLVVVRVLTAVVVSAFASPCTYAYIY